MKLLDLFEYDPRVARAVGQAASGIGTAASKLKGPLTFSDLQGRVEQGIDKLEQEIQKNPNQPFAATFRNFLEKEKDAVKVTGKIGMAYQNEKLIQNGRPNSAYIRGVLRKFYKELNKYLEKSQTKSAGDYYAKQKPAKGFKPEI